MKAIFHRPIGTLATLGSPREWIEDTIALAIVLATAFALLLL